MSTIQPIFGGPFPTDDPATLGGTIAQMVTTSAIEVMLNLADISGQVKVFVLGWDADAGWEPLATLDCTERERNPPLAGRNRFDVAVPTPRYICLYAPDLTAELLPTAAVVPYAGGAVPLNTFWTPWTLPPIVPPAQANLMDQEFASGDLSAWELTGTFVHGGVNRGGAANVAPPSTVLYSIGERPSWLFLQAANGATGWLSLPYGSAPTNWYMTALMSFDTNSFAISANDTGVQYFMAQSSGGLLDFGNSVSIAAFTDASGFMTFKMYKHVGGPQIAVPGAEYTCPEVACHINKLVIHKIGTTFRAFLGTTGGAFMLLGETVEPALAPDRFGFVLGNASVPNMVVGCDYIRHIEAAVVNE